MHRQTGTEHGYRGPLATTPNGRNAAERGLIGMCHIQKRLQKLKKAIRPDDNSFTFIELCRSVWQQDKDRFREMANSNCPEYRIAIGFLEAEDREAERAQKRSR